MSHSKGHPTNWTHFFDTIFVYSSSVFVKQRIHIKAFVPMFNICIHLCLIQPNWDTVLTPFLYSSSGPVKQRIYKKVLLQCWSTCKLTKVTFKRISDPNRTHFLTPFKYSSSGFVKQRRYCSNVDRLCKLTNVSFKRISNSNGTHILIF